MKTCQACGMPAPASTDACGFCTRPFPSSGPVAYRLRSDGDGYRWTGDDDGMATATWRHGTWNISDVSDTRPAMTLVPVDVDGETRVALVDHRSRLVATYMPSPGHGTDVGVVRDNHEQILLLARNDGPTGIHVVDATGNVVALASRVDGGTRGGLDVLLMDRAVTTGGSLVLGLTLLLELARLGELRRVA